MSSKKQRIAKGLGASGLAVATVISGLSFGAASATAAPAASTQAITSGEYKPFVMNLQPSLGDDSVRWAAQDVPYDYSGGSMPKVYATKALAIEAAKASGVRYSTVNSTEWLQIHILGSDNCMTQYTALYPRAKCDPSQDDQLFKLDEQGRLVSKMWQKDGDYLLTTGTMYGDRITPTFGKSGEAAGLEAWLGASTGLTATATFSDDVAQRATVSGTGKPGASIAVKNGSTVVASTTTDTNGDYSVQVAAPNRGGIIDLTVEQTVDGSVDGSADVALDYGKAVEITGPEDQSEIPGANTAITGTGEPGSMVQVYDNDGRNPITSTTVRDDGTWAGAANLSADEHTLEAKQQSKGANTTTATVTVNPGESAVEFTAAGRFDATDATKPATAHGSAPAGSTVILRNSVGQEIGRATAGADETYEITIDPSKATSGVNTFSAIVQGDADNAKSFTLDYGMPATPVVVTTPAKNGTVEPGVVRFAGTGQAGSKIVVRGSSRQVATATVNAQGAWSADSTMELSKGAYNLYFDQTSKGGLKSTMQHPFTIGETAAVVTPHTVTSPSADQVLDTLTPEFRGTGHEGATITVRGSSRVVATGTVRDGQWVAATSATSPLAPGEYNLYVDQSVRGTVTGTVRVKFTVSNEAFRELTLSAPAQNANVTVLRPTFVGTATPGAQIRVGSSRTTVATATVAADGTWRATADFDLARGGTYAGLEVKQTLKSGKTSTVAANFTIDRNAQ